MIPRTDITAGRRNSRAVTAPCDNGPPLSVTRPDALVKQRRPGRVGGSRNEHGAGRKTGEVDWTADEAARGTHFARAARETAERARGRAERGSRGRFGQRPKGSGSPRRLVGALCLVELVAERGLAGRREVGHEPRHVIKAKEKDVRRLIQDSHFRQSPAQRQCREPRQRVDPRGLVVLQVVKRRVCPYRVESIRGRRTAGPRALRRGTRVPSRRISVASSVRSRPGPLGSAAGA